MLDKQKALFGQAQDLLLPLEDPPALTPLCLWERAEKRKLQSESLKREGLHLCLLLIPAEGWVRSAGLGCLQCCRAVVPTVEAVCPTALPELQEGKVRFHFCCCCCCFNAQGRV